MANNGERQRLDLRAPLKVSHCCVVLEHGSLPMAPFFAILLHI